ncbi:nucleotide sugar dehydrogenase [Arthrobacter sp. zg-Y179]|uniref:nucleotide sugar dehydrogenase n=1 Tax=Arthrobacter sp. zg-Y179 TaxID=2894188 RepID=UPI002F407B95|nr:nucleotide sugar dehydrogenase [Arthrobacter sp. zg-Y179]
MPFDVVVMGQGYVGLPLAREAANSGLKVAGYDPSAGTVELLNSGVSHIDDVSDQDIAGMIAAGYQATSDETVLADARTIVICVPTPLGDAGAPDLGAVVSATESIARHLTSDTLVVLESTTYPGTTEDVLLPILASSGLEFDADYFLAFSPERIDPGNKIYGLKNTPKVVGGLTPSSTARARTFYERFVDIVIATKGAKEAETAKLLENTYRHVNIALVNEMSKFCHELGIDLWDVIRAAKTKPFGFQAFYPGPGVGGHCIPIDPNYLSFEVRKTLNYPFRFVELAEEINNSMPGYVARRVQSLLNMEKKSLNGSQILLLGVTYKADIADQRESPASEIADLLESQGAQVDYHDPYVANWLAPNTEKKCITDLERAAAEADAVVLLQSHSEYEVDHLAGLSKIFLDTRGTVAEDRGSRL